MTDPANIGLLADRFNGLMLFALVLLVQATVIMTIGLTAAFFSKKRGAVVQSVILRITLISVFAAPFITSVLHLTDSAGITIRLPIPRITVSVSDMPLKALTPRESVKRTEDSIPTDKSGSLDTEVIKSPTYRSNIKDTPESNSGSPRHEENETILTDTIVNDATGSFPETDNTRNSSGQITLQSKSLVGDGSKGKSHISTVLTILFFAGIIVWFGYSVYLLIRLILANYYIECLRKHAIPAATRFQWRCNAVSRELGIKPPVVLQSPSVVSPIIAGIFRPFILLPLDEHTDIHSRREVFLHELTHIKRHDFLWNQLRNLGTVLLPFHPLMWIISFKIEELADYICDDYVIVYNGNRQKYIRNLTDYSSRLLNNQNHLKAGVGFISFRSLLYRRIIRICDKSRLITLNFHRTVVYSLSFVCMCASAATGFINITNAPPFRVSENYEPRKSGEEHPHPLYNAPYNSLQSQQITDHTGSARNTEPKIEFTGHISEIDETVLQSLAVDEDNEDEDVSPGYENQQFSVKPIQQSEPKMIEEKTTTPESLDYNHKTADNEIDHEITGFKTTDSESISAGSSITADIPVTETIFPEQATASLDSDPQQTSGIQGFGFTVNRDISYIKIPSSKALNVVLEDYKNKDYDLSNSDERKQYNIFQSLEKHQNEPAWSPDGKWIAFTDYSRIWIVSSSGGEPKLIYENFYDNTGFSVGGIQSLCFSADGKKIIFQKNVYDTKRGSEVTQLGETSIVFSFPTVNVEQVTIETGKSQVLFRDAYRCTVSPNGTYIAFLTWNQFDDASTGVWPYHDRLMLYDTTSKNLPNSAAVIIFDSADLHSVPIYPR